MYERVSHLLGAALNAYASARGIGADVPVHLTRPPSRAMGDYASNVALLLAEREGRRPAEVARELLSYIDDREGLLDGQPQLAGKGFLNFRIRIDHWLSRIPLARSRGTAFFLAERKGGDRINVEFVSANPTGPLHVGHGRGAVMGDALVKILRAAGHDAASEYYVNDRGRQVHNLGVSLHYRYAALFDPGASAPEGEDWYRGMYVEDLARELRKQAGSSLLGAGGDDPRFREFAASRLEDGIREDLEALGVTFDTWFHETQLSEETLQGTIEELIRKGHAWKNEDGSVAFKFDEEDTGDPQERILVKRTGDYTYFGTDIPYHLDKIRRGFTRLINIWGADHHGYVPRMIASLKAFGYDPETLKVILVQMVSLNRSGQPIKMSKRSGEFVTLREIVDEVGRDAFRFIFLTRRPDSQFDFDIDLAKKRNLDNPVFHVQYGHARLCSILRKAREMLGVDLDGLPESESVRLLREKLVLEEEREILKDAFRIGEVIQDSARTLQPHRLATFAMDISKALQSYYTVRWRVHGDPVLPPESTIAAGKSFPGGWDVEKTLARLLWIDAVRIAVKTALDLLGVSAPEKMEKSDGDEET